MAASVVCFEGVQLQLIFVLQTTASSGWRERRTCIGGSDEYIGNPQAA